MYIYWRSCTLDICVVHNICFKCAALNLLFNIILLSNAIFKLRGQKKKLSLPDLRLSWLKASFLSAIKIINKYCKLLVFYYSSVVSTTTSCQLR